MSVTIRKNSPSSSLPPQRIAFDNFEVDLRSGELRKSDCRIRLQAQPFQLLALLLLNPHEVVTREEICRELWPTNTFVDFEHSLAAAVNKVRDALGDSAENPKYVETLPKRGYRFIGKIKAEPPVVIRPPGAPETEKLAPVDAPQAGIRPKHILVSTIALVLVAAALFLWFRPRILKNPEPLVAVPFTTYPGIQTAPAISPDGTRIAFAWDNRATSKAGEPVFDLYVKAVGSETLLRLTQHPADWISSAWSPDGTRIAFHRLAADDNGIYVVPAMGGPELKLLETHTPYDVAGLLSWSPDGKWLAFADRRQGINSDRTYLLNVATREVRDFPQDPACIHEGSLTFSHTGNELAHLCVHNLNSIEYFVTDLEGKSKRSLATRPEFPRGFVWSGNDQSLLVANGTTSGSVFREIRMDGSTQELADPAGAWPAISADGRKLAFSAYETHINIWKKDLLHPELPAVQMLPSTRMQNFAQYSPDGKHIVFDSARTGIWSIWLADVDGNNLAQITYDKPAGLPRWSPDSRQITFQMTESDGSEAVYTANISDRVSHKLPTGLRASSAPSWSPDGKYIYFRGYEGSGHQIYRYPVEGGPATVLAAGTEYDAPLPSPDGKTLYFAWSWGSNDLTVLALDHAGATPQTLSPLGPIMLATGWAVVPHGIYFAPQNDPRSIRFYEFASQKSHEVFRAGKDLSDGMSLSPDGRYMLYSQTDDVSAGIMLINNFH